MADEVLKLVVTADTTKAQAAIKGLSDSMKMPGIQSHPGIKDLNAQASQARVMLDQLTSSATKVSTQTTASSVAFADLGASMSALGGPMGIVTGAIVLQASAIGAFNAALISAGVTFHDVMATMAGRTGETGAALQRLGNDFVSVFAAVPQSANEVADVVTKLHARFDLTGETLQTISTGMLNFARVTGTPTKSAMDSLVSVMSSWDVTAKDMPKLMDMMTVAFQRSNIEVPKLAGYLEGNDEALKQFGFDLTSSIALITNFEKRGVNIQKIFTGLNKAAPGFAEAGIDPIQGLQDTIRLIKDLDNQHALLIARQIFGAKVAVEFVGAIKGGAFDIGAMTVALQESAGATTKAAESAFTLMDTLNQMKNATTAALMPLGKDLVDSLKTAVIPAFSIFYFYLSGVIEHLKWLADHTIKPAKGWVETGLDFALGTSLAPGGAPRFKDGMLTNKELLKQVGSAAPAVDFLTGGTGVAGLDSRRTWPSKAQEDFKRMMAAFGKEGSAAKPIDESKFNANILKDEFRIFQDFSKAGDQFRKNISERVKATGSSVLKEIEGQGKAATLIAKMESDIRIANTTNEADRSILEYERAEKEFLESEQFKTADIVQQLQLRGLFEEAYRAKQKAASDRELEDLNNKLRLLEAKTAGRTPQEGAIFEMLERQRQEMEKAKPGSEKTLGAIHQKEQLDLMQQQYDETFNKIKGQAEGVFDAIFTSGKKGFAGLLDYIKATFLTKLKDAFGTLVATLFAGPRPGQGGNQGGLFGGLFSGISSLFGGKGGTAGAGGGLGARLKQAFGFGGAVAGTAGTALAGGAASLAGPAPKIVSDAFGNLSLGAGGAGGSSAASGGSFFGLSGAQLGAFFTNPFTIAAGIGIAATIAYLKLRKTREEKFRAEILRDFAINVPDGKILKQIKQVGESVFGKEADKKRHETLRLDQVQGLLLNYATASGQDPSRLPIYQRFYGQGLGNSARSISFDPSRGIPSFGMGTAYVPRTGLALVHQGERIIPAALNSGGAVGGQATFNINISGAVDPEATARVLEQAVMRVIRRNNRQVTSIFGNTVNGDFQRRNILGGLIGG